MLTVSVAPIDSGHLPEADLDVIVFLDNDTSTLGALDSEGWVDCNGLPFDVLGAHVVAWTPFPSLSAATEVA